MLTIGLIITICGLLGGYANFHRFESNTIYAWFNLRKSLLTGIVASATVPLFLQMVSSNLLVEAGQVGGEYKYFIFGGFCLIAAYFSNRFLQSVSDKVIQDLQTKTRKIEEEATENKEKVEALIDKNSDEVEIENLQGQEENGILLEKADDVNVQNILQAFTDSKYSFRTVNGLSKVLGMNTVETKKIINELKNKEVLKMHTRKNGSAIYSITEVGKKIR